MNRLVSFVIFLSFYVIGNVTCQQYQQKENREINPQYKVEYLDPKSGQQGYDLFYYDGLSLRDEKWRFDPLTGVPAVNHRHGFRQKGSDKLFLSSTKNNGQGFSYSGMILDRDSEQNIIANRVEVPTLFTNGESVRQGPIQAIAGAVQTISGVVGNVAGAVINPQAAFSSTVQKVGQQVISGLQSAGQTVLGGFSGGGGGGGGGGGNRPFANLFGNILGRPGKQGEDQKLIFNAEGQTLFQRPVNHHRPAVTLQQQPSQQIPPFNFHPFRPPFRPTQRPPQPEPLPSTQVPQPFPTLSPEPQPFPTLPPQPQPFPTLPSESITTDSQKPQPFPTLPPQPQPFPTLPPESTTSKSHGTQTFPTFPPQTTRLPIYDIDVRHLDNIYKPTDSNTNSPPRVLRPVIPGLPEEDEDYVDEEDGVGNRINPNAIKSLLG